MTGFLVIINFPVVNDWTHDGITDTDQNGNSVFNSVSISEKSIDNCLLSSNYYTLRNNIENEKSSAFISENPSLDQIEQAATDLASDFFILTKKSKVVVMVVLQGESNVTFSAVVLAQNKQFFYSSTLKGDITENRAKELIEANYDTTATIEKDTLKFNGKKFVIIQSQTIEDAVVKLIKDEKLNKKKPSDIVMLSKKEQRNYILEETKEGGELDFFTEIKGKEYDGIQIKPGVFATNKDLALYKWGRACYSIGVNTIEDVYSLYSEFKEREISQGEKETIKMGFDMAWEE